MLVCVPVSLLIFIHLIYFYRDVHAVCLWDDKGSSKIHQALKEDILEFIKQAQAVSSTCFPCLIYIFFFLVQGANYRALDSWQINEHGLDQ
jgi:hypothetical protein